MSPSDAAPLKLSWSRIRTHEECPEKGKLFREGRKYPLADYRVFFPGTVTDKLMREWLHDDEPQRGWMAAQVDRAMDQVERGSKDAGDGVVRWKHDRDRAEVRELCSQAVHQLEADLWTLLRLDPWCEAPCGWDPAPRFEVPITIPYHDQRVRIFLIGEIDLLVQAPEGIEVWDLKTTRNDQYWRKTLGQLLFYEIAMFAMKKGEWPVRSGLLQPLCNETTPSWQFGMTERTQMLTRIAATATDILDGRLPPIPAPAKCRYCEVKHACSVKGGGRGRVQGWPGSR